MARKQWYFGRVGYTPTAVTTCNMRYIAAPDTGLSATRTGYAESISFENGGAGVVRSNAAARTFDCDFAVSEASGQSGLDVYSDYAQGLYGSAPIYVADPMNYNYNLFPPNWASPMLTGQGWKPIHSSDPTAYPATPANAFGLPIQGATYNITTAINTIPTGGRASIFIPIPNDMTLVLGATGVATGTAVVQIAPVTNAGAFGTKTNMTLNATSSATRLGLSVGGSIFAGVIVYLTRTSTAASTLTLYSMMAQLYYTGNTAPTPSQHLSGEGQAGMEFSTEAIPETYTKVDNMGNVTTRLKGMSFAITEVTPWRGGTV